MLRYGLASVVAAIIVVAGIVFVSSTRRSIAKMVDDWTEQSSESPPQEMGEVTGPTHDFGTELTGGMLLQIKIADLLSAFWYFWVPLVFAACLGCANLLAQTPPPSSV